MPTDAIPVSGPTVVARPPAYDPRMLGGGALVPYVGSWSGEDLLPTRIVQRASGGIGYADETLMDRDEWGVLWTRVSSRIGVGRPLFSKLHSLRQRRAMRRLLCQVCAQPADRTEQGVLWLVSGQSARIWPEGLSTTQPPLCAACAVLSVATCPALRANHLAIRAHTRISGVTGVRFQPGRGCPTPAPDDDGDIVDYRHPAIRWIEATQLARSLHHCTVVDLDGLAA